MFGFLVQAGDYEDLKSKNFWRIVIHSNMQNWQKNGDMDLAKIYNGSEFTKLSVVGIKELLSIAWSLENLYYFRSLLKVFYYKLSVQ